MKIKLYFESTDKNIFFCKTKVKKWKKEKIPMQAEP